MSSTKQQILDTLKKNQPEATELPSLDQEWIQYEDPLAQFQTVLEAVGGSFIRCRDIDEAKEQLASHLPDLQNGKIYSRVPDLVPASFDIDAVQDPHELEDIDYCVFQGKIFVAENAAIWLDDQDMGHRVSLFIAQHAVIVVRREDLVHNLYEAYQRLSWDQRQFGVLVSGPSKTADIEQSLVIGAHGARSHTVIVLD